MSAIVLLDRPCLHGLLPGSRQLATCILLSAIALPMASLLARPPTVGNYDSRHRHRPAPAAIGGVPAMFKLLTVEAGLSFNVSLETVPGVGRRLPLQQQAGRCSTTRPYDVAVLQATAALDPRPSGATRRTRSDIPTAWASCSTRQNPTASSSARIAPVERRPGTLPPRADPSGRPAIASVYQRMCRAGDVLAEQRVGLRGLLIPARPLNACHLSQTSFASAEPAYDGTRSGIRLLPGLSFRSPCHARPDRARLTCDAPRPSRTSVTGESRDHLRLLADPSTASTRSLTSISSGELLVLAGRHRVDRPDILPPFAATLGTCSARPPAMASLAAAQPRQRPAMNAVTRAIASPARASSVPACATPLPFPV